MERHLIHRDVFHWQAKQYRVHNRRWIAFDGARDGDLLLITEPALLTRCAWQSHAIYRAALKKKKSAKKTKLQDYLCSWRKELQSNGTLPFINQVKNYKDFNFAYISRNNNSLIDGIICRASCNAHLWFFTTDLDVKQNYKLDYKLSL